MSPPNQELPEDPELRDVLRLFDVENAPARLDERVLRSYREAQDRRPRPLGRWLTAPVAAPAPVAAALAALLLVAGYMAGRASPASPPEAGRDPVARTARTVDRPLVTNTSLVGFEPVAEIEVQTLGREVRDGQ